jgi:uncharacterized protein
MALEMKELCEKCQVSLARDAVAYICIYECTFCSDCSEQMRNVCPNCGGELVRRPQALPKITGDA